MTTFSMGKSGTIIILSWGENGDRFPGFRSGHTQADACHKIPLPTRREHRRYLIPMHEVSVVTSLVDAVIAEPARYRADKINNVTAVCDLTNLGEEQMAFAYEIVPRGTILEFEFIVEHEPVEPRCDSCGYWGPAKILTNPDFDTYSIPVLSYPECGAMYRSQVDSRARSGAWI